MIGEFPGLAQLDDDDNLRATSDFRGLYCSIIEQWFGGRRRRGDPRRRLVRPPDADRMRRPERSQRPSR